MPKSPEQFNLNQEQKGSQEKEEISIGKENKIEEKELLQTGGWESFIIEKAKKYNVEIETSVVNFENMKLTPGTLTHYTFLQNIESIFQDKIVKARQHHKGYSPYQTNESDVALSLNLFLTDTKKNEFNSLPSDDINKYLQIRKRFVGAGDATNPNFNYWVYFENAFTPCVYFLFEDKLNKIIASEGEQLPDEKESEYEFGWSAKYMLEGINLVRAYEKIKSGDVVQSEIEHFNKRYNPAYGLRTVRVERGELIPLDVPIELVGSILIDSKTEKFLMDLGKKYKVREVLDPSREEIERLVGNALRKVSFSYPKPKNLIDQKIVQYDIFGTNFSIIVNKILEDKKKRNGINLIEVLQEIEKVKFLRKNYYRFSNNVYQKLHNRWFMVGIPESCYNLDEIFESVFFEYLHEIEK